MDTPHEKEMFKELKLPARTAYLSHVLLFPQKETTEKSRYSTESNGTGPV